MMTKKLAPVLAATFALTLAAAPAFAGYDGDDMINARLGELGIEAELIAELSDEQRAQIAELLDADHDEAELRAAIDTILDDQADG